MLQKRTQKDNNWRYLKLATIFTHLKWTEIMKMLLVCFCHNLPNICSCSVIVLIVSRSMQRCLENVPSCSSDINPIFD